MNDSEKKELATLIQGHINELETLIKSSAGKTQEELAEQIGDEISRMETTARAEVDDAVLIQARKEIIQLKNNLEWLQHDYGGLCEACGCIIPIARLKVVPTTRLCIDCASLTDK